MAFIVLTCVSDDPVKDFRALDVTSSEPLTQPDNLLSADPLSGELLKPLSLRHWSITKGSSRRNFQPLKRMCQHLWCAHWSYQFHAEWFIMTADVCQVYRCHKDKRKKGIKRSTYDEEKTPASSTQTSVASLPDRIFSNTVFALSEEHFKPMSKRNVFVLLMEAMM